MDLFIDRVKLIIKQFLFQIKYVFSNPTALLMMVFFLLCGTLLQSVLIPFRVAGAVKLELEVITPMLLLLGGLSYNWRKSTLHKNEEITKTNSNVYYMSLLLTLIFIGNMLTGAMMLLDWGTTSLGWSLADWGFLSGSRESSIDWNNIRFENILYIVETNILLTFAFYFFFHRFTTNEKSYYVVVLVTLILMVIFGGSLNQYFGGYRTLDGQSGSAASNSIVYGHFQTWTFPEEMFVPSLLLPFYSTGTFFNESFTAAGSNMWSEKQVLLFGIKFAQDSWQWSMVVIMPWIYIGVFGFAGIFMSKIKKQ